MLQKALVCYWSVCSLLGVLAVYFQIRKGDKASTVVRKTFHVLTVLVYAPGIILRPCFLYLASGVVFGILMAIDVSLLFICISVTLPSDVLKIASKMFKSV